MTKLISRVSADLDEVWSLLGISGCPQCLCSDGEFGKFSKPIAAPTRSMTEAKALITTCRRMRQERNNVTNVMGLLNQHRLHDLHLSMWNPFFLLPHVEFDCFPQDHLHGM